MNVDPENEDKLQKAIEALTHRRLLWLRTGWKPFAMPIKYWYWTAVALFNRGHTVIWSGRKDCMQTL